MQNQDLSRHSHGGWAVKMEKWLCWGAMAVSGLMLVLFILDITPLKFPFGRTNIFIDLLGVIACGVVGYLGWDALKDLK